MVKGLWSGLTNCEVCIYDYNCGTTCLCLKKSRGADGVLDDQTPLPSPLEATEDSGHVNKMCENVLSEYEIVTVPDPTSSVSIVQVPQIPKFSEHDGSNC